MRATAATTQEIVAIFKLRFETVSASIDNETSSSAFNCFIKIGSSLFSFTSIACKISSGVLTGSFFVLFFMVFPSSIIYPERGAKGLRAFAQSRLSVRLEIMFEALEILFFDRFHPLVRKAILFAQRFDSPHELVVGCLEEPLSALKFVNHFFAPVARHESLRSLAKEMMCQEVARFQSIGKESF